MNSRKRPAAEPLLPLHSAKQRRTRMVGYDGGNPSASEDASLLSRWMRCGREIGLLMVDTAKTLSHSPQQSTHGLGGHELPPRLFYELPTTLPPSQQRAPQSLQAGPPGSSMPNTQIIHQQLDMALSSHQKQQSRTIPPKYRKREHIYAKAHKASVRAETQRIREEIQRDIYTIKRNRGYASNFTDFRGLLAFQAKLERLDKLDALSRLHTTQISPSSRRHSYSDNDDMEFLRRAFDRAKATLNAPRPPQPFQPTLDQLRLSHRRKDQDIEQLLRPKLKPPTPLPIKDDTQVDVILKKRGVIARFAREQVNDQDVSRLRPSQWLNDEIINFYGAMILGRSDDCKENPPKTRAKGPKFMNVYYFSTFFWPKLKEGYEKGRLAKWTKKVDIFAKDVILIPVNHSNAHWTSAAINFRRKRIESYDSMGTRRDIVFKLLRSYLDAEHRNKKKTPFDFTGWEDYSLEEPLQENGYDCGVFTCQYLQGVSRGDEFVRFTQKDMPFLRRRMIWEIGNATLRDEP